MATIAGGKRSDDEARICLSLGPLGLGDDAPLTAPALAGRPGEVFEAARRPASLLALFLRLAQLGRNCADEASVSRLAKM
jgi:hypothetical protein